MQSPRELPAQRPQGSQDRYVRVDDLAALLAPVSRKHVYTLIRKDVIPAVRTGRRILLYREFLDAIRAEIDACRPVDVAEFSERWKAARAPVPAPAAAVS